MLGIALSTVCYCKEYGSGNGCNDNCGHRGHTDTDRGTEPWCIHSHPRQRARHSWDNRIHRTGLPFQHLFSVDGDNHCRAGDGHHGIHVQETGRTRSADDIGIRFAHRKERKGHR